MRKYLFSFLLICMTFLFLASCSSARSNSATETTSENYSETAETESLPVTETFDAGDFTLELPEGWKAFVQSDLLAGKDAEGNYPADHTMIYVSRDAKDEWELFSKAYLNIKLYSPEETVLTEKDWYEDTEDFPMVIQGVKCSEAFSGEQTIVEGFRDEYIHVVFDKGQFVIKFSTEIEGRPTGLSHDDPEVVTILESLRIK